MRADLEELPEMSGGIRNRIRRGDADAVEAERVRLLRKPVLQLIVLQKSRST